MFTQERYLTTRAVSELTTLSRATIERKVKSGELPAPIYISQRRKVFREGGDALVIQTTRAWARSLGGFVSLIGELSSPNIKMGRVHSPYWLRGLLSLALPEPW